MNTLRRLIYKEVLYAVAFVTLGFLALFFFFDFVDELSNLGAGNGRYQLNHILLYVTFLIPSHLYELLPISVLIGTIFVMARFAQNSEFTILRTSGLGPWRALRALSVLGLVFVVLTFAVGDYLAPLANRTAQLLKSAYQGNLTVGQTGAWIKERQRYNNYTVNVGALDAQGQMRAVRIVESAPNGTLVSVTQAASASFNKSGGWTLHQATRNEFALGEQSAQVERSQAAELHWPTEISPEMVSVALLKPERMSTLALFDYMRHLQANGQTSQRYEIEFWRKLFYPLSCLVMVVLALPFAYLHFRSGAITGYVFLGVLIGISFFLLNNVFGYIGNLRDWQPWLAAALPGLLYTLLSLSAFSWLVLRQ